MYVGVDSGRVQLLLGRGNYPHKLSFYMICNIGSRASSTSQNERSVFLVVCLRCLYCILYIKIYCWTQYSIFLVVQSKYQRCIMDLKLEGCCSETMTSADTCGGTAVPNPQSRAELTSGHGTRRRQAIMKRQKAEPLNPWKAIHWKEWQMEREPCKMQRNRCNSCSGFLSSRPSITWWSINIQQL